MPGLYPRFGLLARRLGFGKQVSVHKKEQEAFVVGVLLVANTNEAGVLKP
jgi:hypothetical protein